MSKPYQIEQSVAEREALVWRRDHDRNPQVRERCAAVLKVADGSTAHAVAQHGLLKRRDPDTVYGWLHDYLQGGLSRLSTRLHGGVRRRRLRAV